MKKLFVILLMVFVIQGVFGQWDVEESEDLMSGTTDVFLVNVSIANQGALNDPVLAVRKGETDEYEVFIHWGGYSLGRDDGFIVGRFGKSDSSVEPDGINVTLSTDRTASFIDDPSDFVDKMLSEDRFVALVYSASGRKMIAVWDVSNLEKVIGLLK